MQTISERIHEQDVKAARKAANDPRTDSLIRKTWRERFDNINNMDATEYVARELHKLYKETKGQAATCNLYDVYPMLDTFGITNSQMEGLLQELRRANYIDLFRTAPPFQFVSFMEDIFNPGWRG